jgi:putative thioredoxin
MGTSQWVAAVGADEFDARVVDGSASRPVVVDFWAPWCGPCRTLGPTLEALAEEHAGAFLLAKVDVDEAQEIAQRFGVRSIPTVLGFREGQVVKEFVGALPEAEVRRFLAEVLPSRAWELAREGAELAEAGHNNAAEERFRDALAEDPREAVALLGLAKLTAEAGETEAALELLGRVLPTSPRIEEAERLAAAVRTGGASGGGDLEELRARIEADPTDLEARFALGRGLAASGEYEPALEALLEVVRRDASFADQGARKAMLDVFEMLGADHPLTERFRGELARALFR